MKKLFCTISCFFLLLALSAQTAYNPLRLWYEQPAVKWTEALPIGNGRLGAMIFGGVAQDRIQFNEETLWTGEPRNYHREGAAQHLQAIRRLLAEGKQKEAEQLAEETFMGRQSGEGKKADWVKAVRSLAAFKGDPAAENFNDSKWPTMNVPAYEGWEAEGFEMDGAVWFRTSFQLPADWQGKNLVLDLNRIRDHDFTYVNGKLVGITEGTAARKYIIPKELLHAGNNTIAVQVLNYFDKGGIAGYKDTSRHIGIYPEGANETSRISLVKKWKYFVQDDEPPAVPRYQADYQPFGDLLLDFNNVAGANNYVRELDLQEAIARTSFISNGIKYTREYFSSAPHQAVVVHISADKKGKVSFNARLTSPHKRTMVRRLDNNTLALSLQVRNGALKGESYLYATAKGGKVTVTNDRIIIQNADEATLYLVAATNYKNYKDVSGNATAACRQALSPLKNTAYNQVKSAHGKEYAQLFNTFSMELGSAGNELLPTDRRIELFAATSDPSLISLFLQYGRYLQISSSRPGTQPANLQGIWNDLLAPPWGSKYTTNINAEMNYWPAEVLNLSPMHEPLFKMIEELAVEGQKTAQAHYNARGWVLHHNTDLWRGTAPINASDHGIWVTGGAWLCHHLWEHFRFTGDTNFLRSRAYPVMKQAALFFVDFLVKDATTGWLISTPSNSPENGGLVAGPTMDHQVIRDLFRNTISAAALLNTDASLQATLKEKLAAIAPNQIGKHGQLQEWLEDKDDPGNKHRHVSHLWGVHPGGEINWDETPELMKAARQSLLYRGDAGTGWSLAWKINFWARFKDGGYAFKMLQMLISPAAKGGGAYPNLFDAHPPFQIDGNFGGAAGIAEMLVQSHTAYIDLLPALPSQLPHGKVKGICARGAFVLDLEWQHGALTSVNVLSKAGNNLSLRYGSKTVLIKTEKGAQYHFNGSLQAAAPATANGPRTVISLNDGWRTVAHDSDQNAFNGFERARFADAGWKQVQVPHNWDAYEGYRRMRHGNRHGYAWYRKTFTVPAQSPGKRYFLFFEGVGSYATVWLNGKKAGYHTGGRTTFTLDVTDIIDVNKENILAVRADHPAGIQDLPWVCGGCSDERGFSEGSQPMGIFRPVQLVITEAVRIEPFGIHVWHEALKPDEDAVVKIAATIRNYGDAPKKIRLVHVLRDPNDMPLSMRTTTAKILGPGEILTVRDSLRKINFPKLWSPANPALYSVMTIVYEDSEIIDSISTPFGIRTISWPVARKDSSKQFLINGQPVFINGIAEYEHLIGNSHAFTAEQIKARVMQMKAAGFNAFRDAHQPHNLRYQQYWDELGFLWWTQISAHVWYNTQEFRNNFKTLLKEWVMERRNSPSVVLWGLQNESKLSADFAKECVELIRSLDPTASAQRLVVTCNGGEGTDWDVPQNWTGTYGGDPAKYGEDLQRQILIGEYGAWRTLDLHTEGGFVQNGAYSEGRMTQLMEMKLRLADSVKDKTAGHFMWLHTSHDNPGRVQGGEGYRELDRIGPVNYKGLLTPWEEPLDVYYMYRSNFAPAATEPMVYIASHTWPDRWLAPGKKDGITIYSNCDEVELFNDVNDLSLGKKQRGKLGTHFTWNEVNIRYNVLYAIGYVNGRPVAKDYIVLRHLPQSPRFDQFYKDAQPLTAPHPGYDYLYRVNCGGSWFTDYQGNRWMPDVEKTKSGRYGSTSWTNEFPGMPPFFASQRTTNDPIGGTRDWKLFQDFRYGRDKLQFQFGLEDGEYLVELYFSEPWFGTGGGLDCTGWRLFDVAFNGMTVLKDLDIWKEAGHDAALKKTIVTRVSGGRLVVSFPRVAAGQAIIAAIAIAKRSSGQQLPVAKPQADTSIAYWAGQGDLQYSNSNISFVSLPPALYGSSYLRLPDSVHAPMAGLRTSRETDVYIAMEASGAGLPGWMTGYENTNTTVTNSRRTAFTVYRKRFAANQQVSFGKNAAARNMYSVFFQPASRIEPAYDLKPVTSYKAVAARFSGPGIGKATVDGKERVVFSKAAAANLLEWDIAVGVADEYSLTVSYNNPGDKIVPGKLELFAADGTLMRTEAVELTPTRQGKSNYINSSTGSMINAGNYKIRLTSATAENISINALDVQ